MILTVAGQRSLIILKSCPPPMPGMRTSETIKSTRFFSNSAIARPVGQKFHGPFVSMLVETHPQSIEQGRFVVDEDDALHFAARCSPELAVEA